MDARLTTIVDIYPSSYDDEKVKRCRDLVSQAWMEFKQPASVLTEYIDSMATRVKVYTREDLREITWGTILGELCMLLRGDSVYCLQATFNRVAPCGRLALLSALIATDFNLCAISDRGVIRETTASSFLDAVREHVPTIALLESQSDARH